MSVALWNLDAAHAARSHASSPARRSSTTDGSSSPITRFGGSSGSARAYFAHGRSSAAIRWNSEKRLRIVCSWFCLPETRTLMTYSACSAASPQKRGAWWAMSTSSMATEATASRRRGGHVERRDDEVSTAKG